MPVGVSLRTLEYFEWTFDSQDKHVGGVPIRADVRGRVIKLQEWLLKLLLGKITLEVVSRLTLKKPLHKVINPF